MKASFSIMPEIDEQQGNHLLIEVGTYGASFIWFRKDPCDIAGLIVFDFTKNSMEGFAGEVEELFHQNALLVDRAGSVTICFGFKDAVLVPHEYYDFSTAGEMLKLIHNPVTAVDIKTDNIKRHSCFNVYAVEKKLSDLLRDKFPEAVTHHSSSLVLEQLEGTGKYFHCTVYHNTLYAVLLNDGLQFAGQFNFEKPVDAAYHLLNCCTQFEIDPTELTLSLSGMVDPHSNLYSELYKYFRQIEFIPATGIANHERIRYYPPHFFSHLTRLASCV